MRGARSVSLPAAAILASGLLFASSAAFAQMGMGSGTQAEGQSQANAPTRKTPAMRERVYAKLAEAQECSEMDDIECAQEHLADVREMKDLNSYETAQMWNFYAFIYFGQDNYREAIRAYEMVLQQPDLPLGMETTTMFTLCQLYFQEERYDDSLGMLDRWFGVSENPGPDPYILRAQIFYQLERFREGIEPVNSAIDVAQTQGKQIQENWYRLLNVFYYELEDYPNVIRVLRIIIEARIDLDLVHLIDLATRSLPVKTPPDNLREDVYDYMMERLRAYYADRDFRGDVFEAVLAKRPARPVDFDNRMQASTEHF